MTRLQLVELEDLPWFPSVLRDGGTAFLEFAERMSGHGRALVAPLEEVLDATGERRIVDLCSGGGGPAATLADELGRRGRDVTITVTDLYPNLGAFERITRASGGRVRARTEPVDATAVPPELAGVRTVWNAFHHLPPPLAQKVLADAVAARQPIAVFEVVSREPAMLLALLLNPLVVTLTLPFWRPFRWPWLLFTLVPILQAFIFWDGIVSWLRIYSVDELRALVAKIEAPDDWVWDIGTLPLGKAPLHGTYLVGYPRAHAK